VQLGGVAGVTVASGQWPCLMYFYPSFASSAESGVGINVANRKIRVNLRLTSVSS